MASVQANGSHDTQNRYNNSIEDCPAWVTWNQCAGMSKQGHKWVLTSDSDSGFITAKKAITKIMSHPKSGKFTKVFYHQSPSRQKEKSL